MVIIHPHSLNHQISTAATLLPPSPALPRHRQGQQELALAVSRRPGDHGDLAGHRAPEQVQGLPTCAMGELRGVELSGVNC